MSENVRFPAHRLSCALSLRRMHPDASPRILVHPHASWRIIAKRFGQTNPPQSYRMASAGFTAEFEGYVSQSVLRWVNRSRHLPKSAAPLPLSPLTVIMADSLLPGRSGRAKLTWNAGAAWLSAVF